MSSLASYYFAQIRVSLQVQMQYRVAMGIWMIWLMVEPIIYLAVWSAVAGAQGGEVAGFTQRDFAGYYIVLLVVNHFTQDWHMWEYEFLVREGLLSGRLIRPVHPIHKDAGENIAYKIFMLVVLVPAVGLFTLLFQPRIDPELWAVVGFVPAVFLAAVLAFLMGWVVALAAFWITRTAAINHFYFTLVFIFSGQFAPLALLPGFLQEIASWTPFPYLAAFPVELLMGRVDQHEALRAFAAQAGWIAVAATILTLCWRRAMKRYSAVGG